MKHCLSNCIPQPLRSWEKSLELCGYAYGGVWAMSLMSMSRQLIRRQEVKGVSPNNVQTKAYVAGVYYKTDECVVFWALITDKM